MRRIVCFLAVLFVCSCPVKAQLKYIVEDFEGFADGVKELKENGLFTYGDIKANIDYISKEKPAYSGDRNLRLSKVGTADFGGWGKGMTVNIELDPAKDYLNFFVFSNGNTTIKLELQEDDNNDQLYDKEQDDSWLFYQKLKTKNSWELVSIPLNKFKDANKGGDGVFNVNYKHGKVLCLIFGFTDINEAPGKSWSFDFICFSQDKLVEATDKKLNAGCSLGAWSKEGNTADFLAIATNFENHFRYGTDKKLGVIHFFQAFSTAGSGSQQQYPSTERINKVIQQGYLPMITLEDHFLNPGTAATSIKQPNLYSIVEGHFDSFLMDWAKHIKQVDGVVLLRILHEFNGDWYPWCIANNDHNPALLIKAYRHIHDIFKAQQVTNVKFIWCPNSMSFPQESWNFILDAWPGDDYVDYVGLDIYNGAGKSALWRSFRKEGIENYFHLTQHFPTKPLLICETASRERTEKEPKSAQDKAGWIKQMSEALSTDMSGIILLTWFNEKETFKVNSSVKAQGAYLDYILRNDHFHSGSKSLLHK